MKKHYASLLPIRLILFLAVFLASLYHTTLLAQNKEVKEGVIRVQVSEELAASLEMATLGRSADNKLQTGIARLDAINAKHNVTTMKRIFPPAGKFEAKHRKYGLHLWYEVVMDKRIAVQDAVSHYKGLDNIQKAEPIYKKALIGADQQNFGPRVVSPVAGTTLPGSPDDPSFPQQWHYNNTGQTGGTPHADISVLKAWQIETGKRNVVVAITDGGIDFTHEDLADNIWVNKNEIANNNIDDDNNGYIDDVHGYNFIGNTGVLTPVPHGTHVAGTIAASTNNGVGVAGVAGGSGSNDGVQVMSCQVFSGEGDGDGFAMTYIYAADNGAVISQNSWGYTVANVYEDAVMAGIDYFIAEAGKDENGNQTGPMLGGMVIFAAGNSTSSSHYYPGFYEPVLSVSATGHEDLVAYYSNFGDWVDIAAPGGETTVSNSRGVLSTLPGNQYGFYQGTSMACPHVSGVAALVVSKFGGPGFTAALLRERLLQTSDYIDDKNTDFVGMLGVGRVNAYAALQDNDNTGPETITDLHTAVLKAKSLAVSFSAPADAGNEKAARYEVWYSTTPMTEDNYAEATLLTGVYPAHEPGSTETITLSDLNSFTTYYIAIRSKDMFDNYGALSNILEEKTYALPVIDVSPTSLSASLLTAETVAKQLTLSNTGAGPLEFSIAREMYMTGYVTFVPEAGTIAAGKSMNIAVTFDAHKLFGGDYDQVLTISSNDTVTTQVSVPLTLSVTDNNASIASLDPATFDFAGAYVGSSKTKTIHLYNDGTDTLRITGVSSNNARFTTDFLQTIKVPAFKEGRLVVTFKPTATATASGVVTLTTNDAAHPTLKVNLAGHGVTPPAMVIAPASLEASLATGQTVTQTLTIKSTGASDLTYTAHAIPGKSENVFSKEITISPAQRTEPAATVQQKHPRISSAEPQTITIKSARESSKPVKVLVISPDYDASDFGRLMAGFKDISLRVLQPDYLTSITAANLVNIDVIIVTNNSGWDGYTTAAKAGDLLADYVDGGGKVIIGNFAYADDDNYKLKGRFIDEHYGPFEPAIGSAWNDVTLGNLIVSAHPLLEEVSELGYTGYVYDVGLADGSTAIAKWSTGELLMATNNNVVGVNILASVSSSDFPWRGDLPTLYHNAINWLAGTSIVRIDNTADTIAAGNELALEVTFDAADLVGGVYANSVYLTTDVPGKQTVEVPATLTVRGPAFTVDKDSVWAVVGKGSTRTKTITLTNTGTDEHRYTIKSKDNGVAPPSTTINTVTANEAEVVPVAVRTKPYDGPVHSISSSTITPATPVPAQATATTSSVSSFFSTDFESYVRGDITLSTDGWIGEYGNWNTHIANPAHGIKHLRSLSDGYGQTTAQSPYMFDNAQPYATTTMQLNLKGTGVTWQIIPFSAVEGMVLTRLHFDKDGTIQALIDDGSDTPKFSVLEAVVPEGYFTVTIEAERSTAAFKIYFDNHEVFSGKGFAGDIQGVSLYSLMEEAGPMFDLDDFFIIDGRKELLPNYLSVSPVSGTLAAGESKAITLTFDATEMPYGNYLSDVTLDVERVEQITVPVTTDVTGDAALTVDAIAYTEASYHQDTVTRFTLHNIGGAIIDYRMKLMGADTTWLSLSTTKGLISMRDAVEVTVNFASKNMTPGLYTAQIVLTSNTVGMPVQTLDVSFKVLTPAVLTVANAVTAKVATAHLGYQPLMITNTGESPLTFSFENLFTVDAIKATYGGESPVRDGVSVLYATGFDDFEDWADVDGQYGWVGENESWQIYRDDVGENANNNYLEGTSHSDGSTSMAYSPVVGKGVSPMSSMLMSLALEDDKPKHSTWQVIPRSVTTGNVVTKFQINTDRTVSIMFRNDAGEEDFKIIPYKFPEWKKVMLRIDVERATSLFMVYLDGVAVFHGQGFAGDIEQIAFFTTNNRYDYLDVDDVIILDGVLPWLGVSPATGTVLNGKPVEVKLILDAQNLTEGTYTDALSITSNDPLKASQQIPVDLTVTGPPSIVLDKNAITASVYRGKSTDETLTLTNAGAGDLTYTFAGYSNTTHSRMGGPDNYSYSWIDSDEVNGPVFDWTDISTTGTGIYMRDNDNEYVDLPFSFPYYGDTYDKVSIISDGVLGFGPGQSSLEDESNWDIPNPLEIPDNFLAPFWDDLDPGAGGVIYYQQFDDKFIIQFTDVPIFNKETGNTFQAILYPDGRIKYQYLSVDLSGSVTIGIEDKTGRDGLQITYNSPYVKDNLAIMIQPAPFWMTPSLPGNTLAGGSHDDVTLHFDATTLDAGVYNSFLFIHNDDFANPLISVPVSLTVLPAYIISGTVTDHDGKPLEGIALQGFPDEVMTDATGFYKAVVPANWSGAFTPMATEYHFTPAAVSVTGLQVDMSNQNFTGEIIMGLEHEISGIRVYPNPSTGAFAITLPNVHDLHIAVYNTAGQVVLQDDTPETNEKGYTMHIAQKGIFVLVIQTKTETHVQRIVVR